MVLQAKLVHGDSYTLNFGKGKTSKVFRNGEWINVTDDQKEYLAKNALERIVTQKGRDDKSTNFIPKFEFRQGETSDTEGEIGESPQAARTRTRKSG